MALTKRLTLNNGILLTDPYIKITNINFNLGTPNKATISVCIYINSAKYNDNKPEVISLKHVCSGGSFNNYFSESALNTQDNNHLSQAYKWLKDKVYINAETI